MLILLFLSSTLFHSLIFTRAKKVFQVFDHSSIFLLIAGSYTPFCLISIGGWLGWTLFSLVWLIAIVGIVYKSLTLHKQETVNSVIGRRGCVLHIRCRLLFIEKCAVYACGLALVRHACSDSHVFFCSLLYVITAQ